MGSWASWCEHRRPCLARRSSERKRRAVVLTFGNRDPTILLGFFFRGEQMSESRNVILVIAVAVLGVAAFGAGYAASPSALAKGPPTATLNYPDYGPGTNFPSWPNGTYSSVPGYGRGMYLPGGTVAIKDVLDQMNTAPSYAKLMPGNRTIAFDSRSINLTVLTMGGDRARNLTGTDLPSYSSDDVFVIYGMINPTLVVPDGSVVHVLVVNLDEDAYHDFVMTTLSPPYPYMAMHGMMTARGGPGGWGMMGGAGSAYGSFMYMMPLLYPADYLDGWAPFYSYTVTLNGGANLWYLCTYPGHAQSGMYGQALVTK